MNEFSRQPGGEQAGPGEKTRTGVSGGVPWDRNVEEFERRLFSRTKVPLARIDDLMDWPPKRIQAERQAVQRTLKRFADAVVNSMENPASVNEFLRSLELNAISRDHDWRAIFSTIRAQGTGCEGYKCAVLIKYLQYLSFRKRLLDYIHSTRCGVEATDEHEMTVYPSEPSPERHAVQPGRAARGAGEGVARIPLGEPIALDLPQGKTLELVLAGHVFTLVGAATPCLFDRNGVMYCLRRGRNMVGRHPQSDVVVDPNFGAVSRAHLIVEWDGENVVTLTDLSSRGTWIPDSLLQQARRPLHRPGEKMP